MLFVLCYFSSSDSQMESLIGREFFFSLLDSSWSSSRSCQGALCLEREAHSNLEVVTLEVQENFCGSVAPEYCSSLWFRHSAVMKCPPGKVGVWDSMEEWALELRYMWVWNIALSLTSLVIWWVFLTFLTADPQFFIWKMGVTMPNLQGFFGN